MEDNKKTLDMLEKLGTAVLEKLGATINNQIKQAEKSVSQLLSLSSAVMGVADSTKKALAEIKEVDSYLTKISIANKSLSTSDLQRIGTEAFDIASDYGTKAANYLSAIQSLANAGYKSTEGLAALSVAMQATGGVTEDIANQYITATDQAYQLNGAVSELTNIFDGANKITNENAFSMAELANGMNIVGSTAAHCGVDVNEVTAALGTMIASTRQSGSEAAQAFKAILLNIRQVSNAEEGITPEGLLKYENACNALNVKLKETKNGVLSLRDPMEVLHELSVAYNKLKDGDVKKTNLLSSAGSNINITQFDALLSQWDTYEKMLSQYKNGTDSMTAEAEKLANSWEGSINRLTNSWTLFISSLTDQDSIVGAANGLSGLVSIVTTITDKVGAIPTLMGGLGSYFLGKNGLD